MRQQISLPLRLVRWGGHRWLGSYLKQQREQNRRAPLRHVLFLVTDHFEPPKRLGVDKSIEVVQQWCNRYKAACEGQVDSTGVRPQYSWFYRYDNPIEQNIQLLSEMVYQGYGEIEFHLHHGNDSSETFQATIEEGVRWFNRFGAMLGASLQPQSRFAYIAGNWALDNARFDDAFSGVDDEIRILSRAGCYADFTFPALGERSQPTRVNQPLYVTDDGAAAAFQRSACLQSGADTADLTMIQGPLYVDWQQGEIEYGALESYSGFSTERVSRWLAAGVPADQDGEVLVVKLHTHGVQSESALFDDGLPNLYDNLKREVEGKGAMLHYVTARECFNVMQGLQAHPKRCPSELRDFDVPVPANARIRSDVPYRLDSFDQSAICLSFEQRATADARLSVKGTGIQDLSIAGLDSLKIANPGQASELITSQPELSTG